MLFISVIFNLVHKGLDWQAIWPIIARNLPSCPTNKSDRILELTSNLNLNLKNALYRCLSAVEIKYISLMFIHVYFILYLVNMKRWSVHVPLELRHYSDLSWHIRATKAFYCLGFGEKGQSTSFLMYLQSYIVHVLVKKFSETCFRVKTVSK